MVARWTGALQNVTTGSKQTHSFHVCPVPSCLGLDDGKEPPAFQSRHTVSTDDDNDGCFQGGSVQEQIPTLETCFSRSCPFTDVSASCHGDRALHGLREDVAGLSLLRL